ncbi:MAG: GGDEF domain-containing protein [Lachnospiraceae bacterium]|nr:GGDEF domain-containing protein [Lachnospiraceae bacterium]MBR1669195.1 GGDEF domain-containing protein [Butyrivibrio sp.]
MSYVFYYAYTHAACMVLLLLILYRMVRGVNKQSSQVYLARLIITLELYFIAEIFWVVVDGCKERQSTALLYVSNIFTYILITLSSYYWYIISETLQRDKSVESERGRHLLALPVLVSAILCISAFWTGLVFYVNERGELVNGRFYFLLIIVPFGYMIAASIKAFSRYVNKDRYAERSIYLMIGVFPLAPVILGLLQAVFWRVPLLCYGAVMAVFYVYITTQESLISIDPLTQTNNRNQMYKYLVQKMKNKEQGMSLFLIMVDIDRLRDINEAYGHAEGDRALIRVAGAIKEACQGSRNRLFVSRYGGDEFAVVAQMAYRAEASWLAEQIRNDIKRATIADGADYDISVSVGISQYDYEAPVSLQAFVTRADSDLYQNKKMSGSVF